MINLMQTLHYSYVLLPFNMTMTVIQRVKMHLEQSTFCCNSVQQSPSSMQKLGPYFKSAGNQAKNQAM